MRPQAVATAVAIATLTVAGCSTTTQPNGFDVCGTHLDTGANIPAKTALAAPKQRDLRPPPAKSVLPGTAAGPTSNVRYLSISDCDAGAVVTVDPATAATLVGVAYARDGGVAALVLHASGAVTVRVWRGGVMTGILTLGPNS